ncbi:F-box domain containing protein [Tanacetum coccineum]
MDILPSNIIFNIFSRVPVKCLARSRCVSKVWCSYIDDRYLTIIHDKRVVEEPTPILYHQNLSRERICFHVFESKQPGTTHYVLEPEEGPFLEYLRLSRSSKFKVEFRGSCNGLMCILQDDGYVITSLAVVHPLRKEFYELPPFPLRFDRGMDRVLVAWVHHEPEVGIGLSLGKSSNGNIKETIAQENVRLGEKKANTQQNSTKDDEESICSGHFKKSKIPRSGGSILLITDELVKVGQTMGYNMEGLAQKAKKDWVKELCVSNKVNFLTLQETKKESMEMFCIKRCWGNYAFDHAYSASVGS